MPLAPGDHLGPYEVLATLGAGGMGEVYKARDCRLDRLVAIKILPDHIARREDFRARFEREARAVASLNHPHICTLHDIGPGYMIMELIEGETLAARIAKGAIPLKQALSCAIQIADALDHAHRAGVTHRDVKPQNIMLTRDGVKVLDFGLAKSTARPSLTDETLTKALTTEGTVLGTPQYMAPEQFAGKEADSRSDIWAFGAVLYEMVTGQKAFQEKNYSSLVAAILGADPPPMSVRPFTPSWLERLVRRCLQKDPEDRYLAMHDIVLDLRSPAPEYASPTRSSRWPWAVAAVSIIAAVMGWGMWLRNASVPPLPVATMVGPPEGSTLTPIATMAGSAISPDGRTLAFVATNERGDALLYVRPLGSLTARALPGTFDAGRPFWSPDSKSLAFIAQGKLKRTTLSGGEPVSLCDASQGRGGTWNDEGVILFGTNSAQGVQRIPAAGGVPTLVTHIDKEAGEFHHYYPQFLPGGRDFFYLIVSHDTGKSGIALGSLDAKSGSKAKIIAQTEYGARYDAASKRLLYIQGQGSLMARRFGLSPPLLTGDPMMVAEGVRTSAANGYADFSVSENGTLCYGQRGDTGKLRFGWRDRSGKLLRTVGEPVEALGSFSLSPEGTRVAYSAGPDLIQADVWVMDLTSGLDTQISFKNGQSPRWSADGRFVYYNNQGGIYRKPADGSGEEELLTKGGQTDRGSTVSPDGKTLLFGTTDIMKVAVAEIGSGKVEPYLKTSANERKAAFSPDGLWVAYASDESGPFRIYIQGYPEKRGKWPVSTGRYPIWRQHGQELYWVGSGNTVMAANVVLLADGVRPARPQELFRLPEVDQLPFFQASPDGQRFLVLESASSAQERPSMVVIQNWASRPAGNR
jgi:eukaryotic-like serine/threonine-protein kinase